MISKNTELIPADKVYKHLPFFIIIGLTIIFSYPYHEGISPFDPGNYAKCAIQFLRGEWDFKNFYCNRIGSYLPIAIAIKLFGFNGYYLTWVTVFELVLLLSVLYLTLKSYHNEIALITCAIIGFSPLMLELSGTLYGDIIAALTTNLCVLWIWYVRFIATNPKLKQSIGGVILAVMWFLALLTKETAVYYLLPMLIVFISDKREKQFNRFWNAAILTGIVFIAIFLMVYVLKTGDLFYRLQIIENVPNRSSESYTITSWLSILVRITVLPIKFIIETYSLFIAFLFAIIQLVNKAKNEQEKFLKWYAISLLVLWWLGTQSLRSWTPILLIDRLWLSLMIPMGIIAAHVLYAIWQGDVKRFATGQIKIVLAIIAVAIIITGYLNREDSFELENMTEFILLRICLLTLIALQIFYEDTMRNLMEFFKRYYFMVLVLLIPLIYNFRTVILKNPKNNNYLSEQENINVVRQSKQPAIIICETSIYKNHGIYYGFDSEVEQQLYFLDWNSIDTSLLLELSYQKSVYLLITKDRIRWHIKNKNSNDIFYPRPTENIPDFALYPNSNWVLVKTNSRSSLYRYKHSGTL